MGNIFSYLAISSNKKKSCLSIHILFSFVMESQAFCLHEENWLLKRFLGLSLEGSSQSRSFVDFAYPAYCSFMLEVISTHLIYICYTIMCFENKLQICTAYGNQVPLMAKLNNLGQIQQDIQFVNCYTKGVILFLDLLAIHMVGFAIEVIGTSRHFANMVLNFALALFSVPAIVSLYFGSNLNLKLRKTSASMRALVCNT